MDCSMQVNIRSKGTHSNTRRLSEMFSMMALFTISKNTWMRTAKPPCSLSPVHASNPCVFSTISSI